MKKYFRCYWSHPHHPPKSLYPSLALMGSRTKSRRPFLVTWHAPFQLWLLPALPSQAPQVPSRLKFWCGQILWCTQVSVRAVPTSWTALLLQQSPSLPVRPRIFGCIQVFSVRTCCLHLSLFSHYNIVNCMSTEGLSFVWRHSVFSRSPWWLSGPESACHAGDASFNPWVGKIPWRRKWQAVSVFLPGKSLRQRSLAGYSPWGCKESETTERSKNTVFSAHCLEERFSRWGKGKKGRGRKKKWKGGRKGEGGGSKCFELLPSLQPTRLSVRLSTLTSETCNFSLLSVFCVFPLCSDFST